MSSLIFYTKSMLRGRIIRWMLAFEAYADRHLTRPAGLRADATDAALIAAQASASF